MSPVAPIPALYGQSKFGYRGRFAPSPSGPLHFGSLIAALGSYLQARHQQGEWLVRMEDIDPPREQPGAASGILRSLERYGLHWDHQVLYQSRRSDQYDAVLDALQRSGLSYHCNCSRKSIREAGGRYPGTCRERQLPPTNTAIRLHNNRHRNHFHDQLLGEIRVNLHFASEDFILRRRDGLYAYQLAVVVDDIAQGITEIVRGADLLEPTVRQIGLYRQLGAATCDYLHLPLAITANGNKLSKQNHAPALDPQRVVPTLLEALAFLGQSPAAELIDASAEELLNWAVQHWRLDRIPKQASVVDAQQDSNTAAG